MQPKQLSCCYNPNHSLFLDREKSTTANQPISNNTFDYSQAIAKPKQMQIHKSFVLNSKNDFMIGIEKQYLCSLFRNVAIKSVAKQKLSKSHERRTNKLQPSINISPLMTMHKIYPNQMLNLTIEGKGKSKPPKKIHSSIAARHRQIRNTVAKAEGENLMRSLLINESHNECKPNSKRSRNYSSSTIKILSLLNKKMCVEFRKSQSHKYQKIDESLVNEYKQIKLHLLGKQYQNKLQSRKMHHQKL